MFEDRSIAIYPLLSSPVAVARRRLGLTRTDAAYALGISVGHLRLLENETRRVPLLVLERIVAALEESCDAGSGGTGILYFDEERGVRRGRAS